MKKECEHTRRTLRRYLRGHVFALERKRIERHLRTCPLCATEYQSLRRVDETTQFLKDVTPVEGVAQKVRTTVSGLSGARKILYRPLWILAALASLYLVAHLLVIPYLREQEREWRELASPAPPGSALPAAPAPAGGVKPPEAKSAETPIPASGVKAADPLVVTILTEDEQAAMRRINEVMRGHGSLRTMRFTDTVREISGELTPKELLTFINRIESAGRITYSKSRFEEFPSAQPLPFLMKIKAVPRAETRAAEPSARTVRETTLPAPAGGTSPAPEPSMPKAAPEPVPPR